MINTPIIGTINISSPWSISYHSMINISSPWSIAYHSMINRLHPWSTAASLHDQQISSMINSLSLDDQHISYMINSWSCMMYYKIMSLWKLSWSLATIPPFSLAGGRRATEQKSESECIDTVCIVHGFMNNIIHNSSCMINIDHWMKDCWSCKINIDHCHERLLIIYHNCWSLDERLLIMYDKHWSLPWKPVDHVSQLLIMYRIVITNTNTAGVKFSGTQQMLYILKGNYFKWQLF